MLRGGTGVAVPIVGASSTVAGVMTATDKQELANHGQRLDQIEEFESTFRTRTVVATSARVSADNRNIGYSLGNAIPLPADSPDAHILITIQTSGEDDIEEQFELGALYAKTPVVADNRPIGSNNALAITRGTDTYYLGCLLYTSPSPRD